MKEKIYTIPVTEAFRNDCECPMCILEKKLEDEYVDYTLGPSLMEPESRVDTNEKGFCRRHLEQLYNKQNNRLGLGLIIDTHLAEQNSKLKNIYQARAAGVKKESGQSLLKDLSGRLTAKQTETSRLIEDVLKSLAALDSTCTICGKLEYTMDRYIDVILYLWFKEEDFKKMFHNKGFCLRHFRMLLEGVRKYLSPKEGAVFMDYIMQLQLENMERIQQEVNWFTKKFDYRNNEAPWGNSKDAIPRSIQKLAGYSDLK